MELATVSMHAARRRYVPSGTVLLLVPALALAVVVVGLLGFVLLLSVSKADNGSLEGFAAFANFVNLLSDPSAVRVATNTAIFALVTVAVSFLLGVPLAWLAERTTLPGRSAIWTLMLATLVMPGFTVGMGWLFLAGPRTGVINTVLMSLFHLETAPFSVVTVYGMGIVQGLALSSLTFVLVAPSLRAMDPSLEEASRMAGGDDWRTLREVTLPLIWPALLASAMYVTIVAIGAFDIPAIIGLSGRVYTFSTFLYVRAFPTNSFPDYGLVAAGGAIMIVLALVMTWIYSNVLRRARRYAVVGGKNYRPRLKDLGRWNAAAWTFIGLYLALALVLPFLMTLLNALLPFSQTLTPEVFGQLTLANFQAIPWSMLGRGGLHSLEIVVVVPVAVVALSLLISWIVLRTRLPGRYLLDAVAFLPHAVPSVLFGIGASLFALFVLQHVLPIYGTVTLVIVVYTIAWISFGTRMINASLIQINAELVEAAQMAGATVATTVREVVAPLLRSALSGLWIYVALLCLRELTLAAFVTTPNNLTLPMVAFDLWNDGSFNQGAAVAVLVVCAVVPFLWLYIRFGRGAEEVAKST